MDRILTYFAIGDVRPAFLSLLPPLFLSTRPETDPLSLSRLHRHQDFSFFGLISFRANPYLHGIAVETLKHLSGWVKEGKIKPLPFEVVPGGLEGLAEGYRRLKAGEVKGRKVVVVL